MKKDNDKIKELLDRRVVGIIVREELEKKLRSGKKLRIKLGVDVARPDIHLGHAVALWKLREFQDLGHTVIFLIGDATTRIGDPTGQDRTRPLLTEEQINKNAETYIEQAGKILDINKTEVRRNSEWFDEMAMFDFIKLLTMVTHSQLIAREAFQERIKAGKEILMHEIIYPVMQGYDSVVLKADVAVHADQLFNEHFGRMLQEKFGQEPQTIMTVPILVGLDGKHKMSKSLDNYVGVAESPESMYGKAMSLPDELIIDYFNLCTFVDAAEISQMNEAIKNHKLNPRDVKMRLAREIVSIYHSVKDADGAEENFKNIFQKGALPSEVPLLILRSPGKLSDILLGAKLVSSRSEFRRLINARGIDFEGVVVEDPHRIINESGTVRVGKLKFLKIEFIK
ncbi:MAG: tyrosine--tRNA ligase [Candidatus Niyogibacteria bacterium]|nr:tyrosine--tRNA ligase [Candidatus Niyogibacteria bacterium]